MTDNRKELLNKLLTMPIGTTLQKGNRKRILLGLAPGMIVYTTPSKPKVKTMCNVTTFMKWAEKAEIVRD